MHEDLSDAMRGQFADEPLPGLVRMNGPTIGCLGDIGCGRRSPKTMSCRARAAGLNSTECLFAVCWLAVSRRLSQGEGHVRIE
jgi:hypothetical protein